MRSTHGTDPAAQAASSATRAIWAGDTVTLDALVAPDFWDETSRQGGADGLHHLVGGVRRGRRDAAAWVVRIERVLVDDRWVAVWSVVRRAGDTDASCLHEVVVWRADRQGRLVRLCSRVRMNPDTER